MTGTALLIHGLSSSPDGWWRVRGWLEQAGWTTSTVALLGHGGQHGAVARTFGDPATWDLRETARALGVPTLVLGGDPGVYTMLEPSDGFEVSQDAADLRYVVVPGAGHSPHRDVPDATRTALMGWLEE